MKYLYILLFLFSFSSAWGVPLCEGDESTWQNCKGTLKSHSGRVYTGIFLNGKFEGKNENEVIYEGEYKDGTMNGQGSFIYTKGEGAGQKYVGEFQDGNFHGRGTFTWADGGKYIGEFQDGKFHGRGTFTWAHGGKYIGEYKDGKRNGQGTLTYANGEKYEGEYKDDLRNGQGTSTFPDGRVWIGEFIDDEWIKGKKFEDVNNLGDF